MSEMPTTLSGIRENMSHHFSLIFENEGFSPLVGKIFTMLLFAPEPVSLQELATKLGVSKAAVSVQIRGMGRRALCNKIHRGNDRKDYYYISDDLCLKVIQSVSDKLWIGQHLIANTLEAVSMLQEIEARDQASHHIVTERMTELSAMYELSLSRLKGLEDEWELRSKRQG